MQRLVRRRFLKQVAFGTGAISLVGIAGVSNAQRLAPANFEMVHGRILTISGPTLAVETDYGLRALMVGARSTLWKGRTVSQEALQPGDFLWAQGIPMRDGLMLITALWANIVNVSGRVDTIISSTTFVMQWGPVGGAGLSPARTTVVTIDGNTIFGSESIASSRTLTVGKGIQVIGTALDENSIYATRIFH